MRRTYFWSVVAAGCVNLFNSMSKSATSSSQSTSEKMRCFSASLTVL